MADDPRIQVMRDAERSHHQLPYPRGCSCGADYMSYPFHAWHLDQVRLDALDRWEAEQQPKRCSRCGRERDALIHGPDPGYQHWFEVAHD